MNDRADPELLAGLRHLPLFVDLPVELLELVAVRARRRRVESGAVLCTAGEPGNEFFVVLTGVVRIVAPTARGDEVVAELGPGEWFGEMALITGEPRSATVIAASDTTVLVLARSDFQQILAQLPAVGLALSHVLSRRLRAHLQRRQNRERPGAIAAVTASPSARDTMLLLNIAAALGDAAGIPVAIVDHVSDSLFDWPAVDGVTVLGDGVLDPAMLRAAHPLLIIWVAASDARTPALTRQADAVWALDDGAAQLLKSVDVPFARIRCESGAAAADTPALQLVPAEVVVAAIVRTHPGSAAAVALRRFARRVLGRRVGLALSAGGAKGLAHVGALRCFERAGLEFDLIAGTSMGGIVGGLIAAGRDSVGLLASFQAFTRNIRRTLLDFTLPEVSLLRGEKKRRAIREQTGEREIQDLVLPFWTVAADLVTGREVVFSHGPLWQALDATSAIPAVFPPVALYDQVLVDGWVVNPLPADILRREGADIVIAVDTSAGVDPTVRTDQHGNALQRLRHRLANPAIVRVVLRAMEVGARERTLANLALVDAAVQPDLTAFSVADVQHVGEIVERGEAAAEAALPAIRAAMQRRPAAANRAP